ncbi:hypothetical protein D3C73_1001210 [compost metagenome]
MQVGRAGGSRQLIGVAVDGEPGAIDLAGQDAVQLVRRQLAQTACGEDHRGQGLRREAVGRQAHLADAGADRDQDLLVLEGRRLDGEAHAVGEGDDGGADGGDLGGRGGRGGGAEVGVGPFQRRLFGRSGHRRGAARLQQGSDASLAALDRLGRDDQGQGALAFKGALDLGADLFRLEILHCGFEQGEVGGGRGEDAVVIDGAQQGVGQGRGAARRGRLDGVFQRRAGVGDLAIQFDLRDAELNQTALLLLDGFQRALDAARIEGGRDAAEVQGLE